MISVMVTREHYDHHTYEYTRVYHKGHRFNMGESMDPNHLFNYIARKRIAFRWSAWKPFCNCGWKSVTWHALKSLAVSEHYAHAQEFSATHHRLFL